MKKNMTIDELRAIVNRDRQRPRHLEEDLQVRCVRWFELAYPDLALLLHHSPNGGRRNAREAARFKEMGTRAGFPDLVLLVPSGEYHYLCIEMKYGRGRQTERQRAYQQAVEANGGRYAVVKSAEEFITITKTYLQNERIIQTKTVGHHCPED